MNSLLTSFIKTPGKKMGYALCVKNVLGSLKQNTIKITLKRLKNGKGGGASRTLKKSKSIIGGCIRATLKKEKSRLRNGGKIIQKKLIKQQGSVIRTTLKLESTNCNMVGPTVIKTQKEGGKGGRIIARSF